MDPRVQLLIETFESKGWKFTGPADVSSDWWFSEIFQLTSTWRPAGTKIYLVLLTDPELAYEKVVWAIGITVVLPRDRHENYIDSLTLNDIKRTDLPAFVDNINKSALIN